jgi:predicted DNA repair protein MutK
MAGGLIALLDDIVLLARQAAASLDDIAVGAAKSASKAAGVVIDDAAVTPQYVRSISPKRELGVIWKITLGSLRNKFLMIIPAALVLTWLAAWTLPYLLIAGGLYLCFEGGHKVLEWITGDKHEEESSADEKVIVSSAVRTDLVLSTEIMLISLSAIEVDNWIMRAMMLSLIAVIMTVLVYGSVGLLVKLDDIGLYFAKNGRTKLSRKLGHDTAMGMPNVFNALSVVGTVAMLWVGGHLIWKSVGDTGVEWASHSLHAFEALGNPTLVWTVETICSAVLGLAIGLASYYTVRFFSKMFSRTSETH